jgi:hypothetical protein
MAVLKKFDADCFAGLEKKKREREKEVIKIWLISFNLVSFFFS